MGRKGSCLGSGDSEPGKASPRSMSACLCSHKLLRREGTVTAPPPLVEPAGCQALHTRYHTASSQPLGDVWPVSSSVADGQVTLEQGGTPHGTEGSHVGWAGPGPRLCTFPCNEPHPGAGLQGRADREAMGPSPQNIMLELTPPAGKSDVIKSAT